MYEASFGLKRRPFAATPDATCFLSSGPIQAALDELVVCAEQGQGIAVLTAPAGTGKTLLCERMCCELDSRYETILLRHSSFMTRRALLQTILCELNHTYHQPTEQELRLELFPAIRALQPNREALVLICDEAHQLTDSLLEELRILADFAESGRPLVRLILVGQPALEEKLAQPGLEAVNQRIRAQINLSPFDRSSSMDYIDYRLTWAGGRTNEVFTPGALELIAQASDGIPRCINQLADHTLLLAFVAEQHPASEELVREALTDLRQLPLQWNEPIPSEQFRGQTQLADDRWLDTVETISDEPSLSRSRSNADTTKYSFESTGPSERTTDAEAITSVGGQANVVEFGEDVETSNSYRPTDFTRQSAEREMVDSDDWRRTVELFNTQTSSGSTSQTQSALKTETFVVEDSKSRDPRYDFHSLLSDAYEAAGDLAISTSVDRVDMDPANRLSSELSMTSSISEMTVRVEPLPTSNLKIANSMKPTSSDEFEEEVVIDRYSAIDAGIEPPAISSNHVDSTAEIQGDQGAFRRDPFSNPINPASFGFDDFRATQSYETILDTPTTAPIVPLSGTTEVTVNDPNIETIAEEVYSLGESLRPSGSLSLPTDSILDALRKEVVDVSETEILYAPPQSATTDSRDQWESIETAPPAPVAESRPFRYLFSMLRRKQHGLS